MGAPPGFSLHRGWSRAPVVQLRWPLPQPLAKLQVQPLSGDAPRDEPDAGPVCLTAFLGTQPGCLWFLGLHPNVSIFFFSMKDFIYLLKILFSLCP